jgi:hypothetical protein
MPGLLLHQGATVMCTHAGQAQPAVPNPRVTVGGQFIVTQSAPYVIAGCPFFVGSAPSPCITGQWITGALRVTASGVPVLLQDSQAVCVPNGTPLNVLVTQFRVKGA